MSTHTVPCRAVNIFGILLSCFLPFPHCDAEEAQPSVLLRFTPEPGQAYEYRLSFNRDTTIRDKTSNIHFDADCLMKVIAKDEDSYKTEWTFRIGNNNLGRQSEEIIKEKTSETRRWTISDRYVYDREGQLNLCFPDKPVQVGSKWEGECLFKSAFAPTSEEPMLNLEYTLSDMTQNQEGTFCLIESRPISPEVTFPFQMGSLGFLYDDDLKVTNVLPGSGVDGKVEVGDAILAVSGESVGNRRDLNLLVERYVEPPEKVQDPVKLTIQRNGSETVVEATKSLLTLGTAHVTLPETLRKTVFHVEKGIVVSEDLASEENVTYDLSSDLGGLEDLFSAASGKKREKPQMASKKLRYAVKVDLVSVKEAAP